MVDGREYEITIRQITNKEAILLEQVAGKPYAELWLELMNGNPTGKAAFLWLAMRKHGRHEEFDKLEFPMGETVFRLKEEDVDPTPASPETPTEQSSSPKSTGSKSGPRSAQK